MSGPRRPPRRSERFASLTRVETINGRPASELTDAGQSSDLPAAWPSEPLPLAGDDPTISGILAAAPFGFGSRMTIVGPPQSGKSEILKRLASALAGREDLELRIVLAGVRPEEIPEWVAGSTAPAATLDLGAPGDSRSQAVEAEVEQARRQAGRGAHTVVLIDTLDGVHEAATRRALAAARTVTGGGSVTVIATASHPHGGETTVLALSPILAAAARWPAIDLLRSWTVHSEKLVGEERAEEIRRLRAQALDG